MNLRAGRIMMDFFERREPEQEALDMNLRLLVETVYGPPVRSLPGLDVGRAYWGATNEFPYGGDMVDVFQYGNGCTSIAVVDISGHGIRAATYAGLTKHALRAFASQGYSAVDAVRALNRLCLENCAFENETEFFATAFFAIIDARRESINYVSAGHEAAYTVSHDGQRLLEATGPILGLLDDDASFQERTIMLQAGDEIVAVTDGFTESRNEQGQFLGAHALAKVIERNRDLTAEQQAQMVTAAAYGYAGPRLQDDVAALVVKVVR